MTTQVNKPKHTLRGSGQIPTSMMAGEVLDGRYELQEIVGEGGMGVVFKATQLSVNRDVAIKVMKSEYFGEHGLVRRFKLEMDIISSLQHPNIVRLLDTGKDKRLGVFFLVMEFVEGVSVGDLLYNHPAPVFFKPELAIEVAIQICGALTEPHRLGVIHRDLKPDNIIMTVRSDEQLDVKLLDFGIARIVEPNERIETSQTSRLTSTGGIVGTPPYIAPELCEASANVSAQSDLYAVGAMLFELLTGVAPFEGRSTAEVLYKHVHEPPPRLLETSAMQGCHCQDLDNLIAELLEKDPADRPESALHVKRRLDQIRQANALHRPTLVYTTTSPTASCFEHYIGVAGTEHTAPIQTLDAESYVSQEQAVQVPTLPPPHKVLTPSQIPAALRTLPQKSVPTSHDTHHAPHETHETHETHDDDDAQYTYELPVSTDDKQRKVSTFSIVALGTLVLVGGFIAIALSSGDEPDPPAPQIIARPDAPIPEEAHEQSDTEVTTPKAAEPAGPPTTLIHDAVSTSQRHVIGALDISLQAVQKTAKPAIKKRPPKSKVTKTSAPPKKKRPPKPDNNIDWLYKK